MKQTDGTKNGVKRCALGAGTALAVYLALLALLAALLAHGTVGEGMMRGCVTVLAGLSAFVGVTVASRASARSAAATAACAAAFWAAVLLLGFLTNDSLDPARAGVLALAVFAGGAAAYFLRGGKGKKGRRSRRSRK